jgi:hypothetical protein
MASGDPEVSVISRRDGRTWSRFCGSLEWFRGTEAWREEIVMDQPPSFAEVLEAVDQLSVEDQEVLVDVVSRRMAERGRKRVASEIQESNSEFEQGGCRSVSVDELMDELLS